MRDRMNQIKRFGPAPGYIHIYIKRAQQKKFVLIYPISLSPTGRTSAIFFF
jgi:hypothetical protein